MKRFITVLFFFIFSINFIVSCSVSPNNNPQKGNTRETRNSFKVATILPGKLQNDGWSQGGYAGLLAIQKEFGATISYQDNIDVSGGKSTQFLDKKLQEYGASGYDFIIGHDGGELIKPLEKAAKQFPRTKFAAVGGYAGNNINFGAISFDTTEAGYLAGAIAAISSKTHKIALINGPKNPDTRDFTQSTVKGIKAINSSIEIFTEWTGDFRDGEKARASATKTIKSGADILILNSSYFAEVLIPLAKSAHIKAITLFNDQYDANPSTVITSLVVKYPQIYLQGATLVRQGRWEGKQYRFGLKEGVVEIAPFRGHLTPDQEEKVNLLKQNIILGKINVSS